MELLIATTEGVRKAAGDEVHTTVNRRNVVAVLIERVQLAEVRVRGVDAVRHTRKPVRSLESVVVHAAGRIRIPEGRGHKRILVLNRREGRAGRRRAFLILLDPLHVGEEEQLVLDNRTTKIAAKVIALERRIEAAGRRREASAIVLEVIEERTVVLVRARTGRHQHLTSRGDLARDVLRGLVQLKFVDCSGRDVEDGRSHGLVRDVLTVEKNTRRTPRDAAHGDGRVPSLGRVKRLAALQQNAGLQLRHIQDVVPIQRQGVDLLAADDRRHPHLIRVHLQRGRRDLDRGLSRTNRQLVVTARHRTGANRGFDRKRIVSRPRDRQRIRAWIQRPHAIEAGLIGL